MHKCILNESCPTHRCTRDTGTCMGKVSRVITWNESNATCGYTLTGWQRPIGSLIFVCHFLQKALYIVALLWKMTCNLRHPMSLRHPVISAHLWMIHAPHEKPLWNSHLLHANLPWMSQMPRVNLLVTCVHVRLSHVTHANLLWMSHAPRTNVHVVWIHVWRRHVWHMKIQGGEDP